MLAGISIVSRLAFSAAGGGDPRVEEEATHRVESDKTNLHRLWSVKARGLRGGQGVKGMEHSSAGRRAQPLFRDKG